MWSLTRALHGWLGCARLCSALHCTTHCTAFHCHSSVSTLRNCYYAVRALRSATLTANTTNYRPIVDGAAAVAASVLGIVPIVPGAAGLLLVGGEQQSLPPRLAAGTDSTELTADYRLPPSQSRLLCRRQARRARGRGGACLLFDAPASDEKAEPTYFIAHCCQLRGVRASEKQIGPFCTGALRARLGVPRASAPVGPRVHTAHAVSKEDQRNCFRNPTELRLSSSET